jgi:hypothetical protein
MAVLRDMQYPTSDTAVGGGWHCEEATGSNILDWSGNAIHIVPTPGTPPTSSVTPNQTNGQITWNYGNCLNFNGTTNFAQNSIASNAAIKLQTFTIEALIYNSVTPLTIGMICDMSPQGANATGLGYRLVHNRTNFYFQCGDGGGWDYFVFPAGAPLFVPGQWQYCVVTFTSGDWKLYLNGKHITTSTAAYTINYTNNPAESADYEAFVIGANKRTTGLKENFLTGQLADLRISNVVRTAAEIYAMYLWLFPPASPTTWGRGTPRYPSLGTGNPGDYEFHKSIRKAMRQFNNLVLGD